MTRVLRSVNNALAVLESFSAERPEIGVTELSQALGLGKSTVHRLLTSLAARGYVRKNPDTDRYLSASRRSRSARCSPVVGPFARSPRRF